VQRLKKERYNRFSEDIISTLFNRIDFNNYPVIKETILLRTIPYITDILNSLEKESLQEIAASTTNTDVLVELSNKSVEYEMSKLILDHPLTQHHLKGLEAKEKLLNMEGGVISSSKVGNILRISRQAVDKRRRENKLLAVSLSGSKEYFYPVWQFDDNGVLEGFEKVIKELKHFDPWMKMIFMLNKNEFLDNQSPIEFLRKGDTEEVIKAAKLTGEQGAL